MSDVGDEKFQQDMELRRVLADLARGVNSQRSQGVTFEIGEKAEAFGSYTKVSDQEVLFKEYDELGYTTLAGKVELTRENGTVAFTLTMEGEVPEITEGWFALGEARENVLPVYFPWRLASDEYRRRLFEKVLAGYEHIKETQWKIDAETGFQSNGVGLSGEEEGVVQLVVAEWGKIEP